MVLQDACKRLVWVCGTGGDWGWVGKERWDIELLTVHCIAAANGPAEHHKFVMGLTLGVVETEMGSGMG